LLEIKTR